MSRDTRINLGSGHWKLEGWINIDIDPESRPDVLLDIARGLPFRDGVVGLMHAEDFVDQLELSDSQGLLLECHRVLEPGGVLRVLVPDLERLVDLYREEPDKLCALWRESVGVPLITGTAGEVFNRSMRVPHIGHAFVFDEETFVSLAEACGFEARRVDFRQSEVPELRGLDQRSPDHSISMYFDCYKK